MSVETTGLSALDLGLRSGAVLLVLLVAALLLREHPRSTAARLGALFAAGAAAHALCSMPGFASPPAAWQAPLIVLSGGNPVVFWLFAQALFRDGLRLQVGHGVAWAALAGLSLVGCYLLPAHGDEAHAIGAAYRVANLVFTLLALAEALRSWRADLVERRRRLRLLVVGMAGAYAVPNVLVQLAMPPAQLPAGAALFDAASLLVVALVIAWPLLRAHSADLFAERMPAPTADRVAKPPSEPKAEAPDPADVAALERLMRVDHVYREEGLTIGALAARLGMPEYKLRRLINQGLGHRNFTRFLNGYRLAETQAALADPACDDVPVLTIAMDAGFQSLGPFNRAFKSETGLTPSEFRRLRGRLPADKSAPVLADSEIG
ncbi:MAG TPA: AraC family transcriptional regulator [Albitalea sp.]|nr:AraC family transcriptional regulator [Albitalea sp.]